MLDTLSSAPQYRAHLLPLWSALPDGLRGQRLDMDGPQYNALRTRGSDTRNAVLVASFRDMGLAWHRGYRRIVLIEHGTGQSYLGLDHGSYAGGSGRDPVGLFLHPNETSASKDRTAYPKARVRVIGDPRLDTLPARLADGLTTVAISFHWNWVGRIPETRSALDHYRAVLPALAERFHLIGHAHPKAVGVLMPLYQRLGIEYVSDFDDVCRRADVYVCDNSSTIFEFASTGRPVFVLNAPWYRPEVEHGGRFWATADVGPQVDRPETLGDAIEAYVSTGIDPQWWKTGREAALDIAYAYRTGAAQRGVRAITEWLADLGEHERLATGHA